MSADVETTGSSNDFHDKVSMWYHITIIMKSLWEDVSHRQATMTESRYTCMTYFKVMLWLAFIFLHRSSRCLRVGYETGDSDSDRREQQ